MPNGEFNNGIYSIKLVNNFSYKIDDERVLFFNKENGYGALSVTSYMVPDYYAFDVKKEIIDYVSSINKGELVQINIVADSRTASCEFFLSDTYWKAWVIFGNDCGVFASYNCNLKDKNMEIFDINQMVQSLNFMLD